MLKMNKTRRFIKGWLPYAWRIPFSIAFVNAMAFVQFSVVLKIESLMWQPFIVPTVVGLVFGLLWSRIVYYRDCIKQQEQLMERLVQDSRDVLALRKADEILFISPRVENLTGYAAEVFKLTPEFFDQLVHPADQEKWHAYMKRMWQDQEESKVYQLVFRILTPLKGELWVRHEATCFSFNGERMCRCVIRDITLERGMEELLTRSQYYDSVSNLPNRFAVEKFCREQACEPLSCCMLELENLKKINLRFGVENGDQVLQVIGARLAQLEREHAQVCYVARWVGDSFLILFHDTPETTEAWAKEWVHNTLEKPIFCEGVSLLIDVRIRFEIVSVQPLDQLMDVVNVRALLHKAYMALHGETAPLNKHPPH